MRMPMVGFLDRRSTLDQHLTSGPIAVNGLDDLRGWTLEGAIQPSIDIYLTQQTLTDISRAFPYLVSKEHASGGGDVRDLRLDASFMPTLRSPIRSLHLSTTLFTPGRYSPFQEVSAT